jgi:hypothetical protein
MPLPRLREPVVELVRQHLMETLRGVTESNGFRITLKKVEGRSAVVNNPEHMACIVVQGDPSEGESPLQLMDWVQPFMILVWIAPRENDPVDIDTYANRIYSEVTRAVLIDPYRGNQAQDTIPHAPQYFPDAVLMHFDCKIRTNQDDPSKFS